LFIIIECSLKENFPTKITETISKAIKLIAFNFGDEHPLISKFYNILGDIFI